MFKVVVVEDEELLRAGLTNFFDWGAYGFELAGEAGNGQKGLEVIRSTRPDLVITDIKMPHMDGIEMTETLMKEMPHLQVVVISGYDEFEYAKRALKAGVCEYILKPIRMEDLKEAIRRIQEKLLRQRREKEELEQLKASHQSSRGLKLASVYARLLLKGDDPEKLEKELSEEVRKDYYQAGLISLHNFAVIYMDCDYSLVIEKDRELEKVIESCLRQTCDGEKREQIEILRTSNGERLLCMSGSSGQELKERQSRMEEWFVRESPEQTDLSFGQPGQGLKGLQNSCKAARRHSEEKFARKWQEAAGARDASGKISFLNYDLSNLCYEIKNGSRQSLHREMDVLRETLSAENISSYLQIVLIISNIYYELVRIPEEAGGKIEEVEPDPRGFYQRLISRMKREEMTSELEDFCIRLQSWYQQMSGDRKGEVMSRVDAYLREHYAQEDLSMKDAAEHAYISVSYLGMIIKKESGKTFTEYLTDIRLEKARQMLVNTSLKNYEIAQACGYTTPAYFSTVFKSVVGKTPTEYRNCQISKADSERKRNS